MNRAFRTRMSSASGNASTGPLEHLIASLSVDIFFKIAGKRSDDLDLILGQKLGREFHIPAQLESSNCSDL